MDCMLNLHWAGGVSLCSPPLGWTSWFYGFLSPGKRVSELLPPRGQDWLDVYSLLGEWVYFGYYPLGN